MHTQQQIIRALPKSLASVSAPLFDFENAVKTCKNYTGNDKDKAEELMRDAKSKHAALLMCLFDFEWHSRRNLNGKRPNLGPGLIWLR